MVTEATPLASEQITDLLIAALPEWQRDVTRKALSDPARYGIPIIPADAALKALAALSASPAPSGQEPAHIAEARSDAYRRMAQPKPITIHGVYEPAPSGQGVSGEVHDDTVTRADMAAFGASDAACYFYPGEDQQAERAAFCEGAAHAVSTPSQRLDAATVERVCKVCTAVVSVYPEGMCCHCHEMPWPLATEPHQHGGKA